jgi:hypothetical protein
MDFTREEGIDCKVHLHGSRFLLEPEKQKVEGLAREEAHVKPKLTKMECLVRLLPMLTASATAFGREFHINNWLYL